MKRICRHPISYLIGSLEQSLERNLKMKTKMKKFIVNFIGYLIEAVIAYTIITSETLPMDYINRIGFAIIVCVATDIVINGMIFKKY
jgi:hypothetical protein